MILLLEKLEAEHVEQLQRGCRYCEYACARAEERMCDNGASWDAALYHFLCFEKSQAIAAQGA